MSMAIRKNGSDWSFMSSDPKTTKKMGDHFKNDLKQQYFGNILKLAYFEVGKAPKSLLYGF